MLQIVALLVLFQAALSGIRQADGVSTSSPVDSQVCPNTTQRVDGEAIFWPSTNASTISKPPCVNEKYEISSRNCSNGTWDAEPSCMMLQREINPCPEGFASLQNGNDVICYQILPPTQYDTPCPYPNKLPMDDYKAFFANMTDDFVWMPYRRRDPGTRDIAVYSYDEPDFFYGVENDRYEITHGGSILGKPCLIHNHNGEVKAVACEEAHSRICAYKTLDKNGQDYCRERTEQPGCYQSDYHEPYKCFCVQPFYEPCPNPAELRKQHQNELRKVLGSDQACRIGLGRTESGFAWTGTNSSLDYTFWTNETDFAYSDGVLNPRGWTLRAEGASSSCDVCEREFPVTEPRLALEYDEGDGEFRLTIWGYDNVRTLKRKNKETKAVCFYHADIHELNHRYNMILSTRKDHESLTYSFVPKNYGPGYYWCTSFKYPDFEAIHSNRLFFHDRQIHGHEFVAKATFPYKNTTNPLCKEYYMLLHSQMVGQMASHAQAKSGAKFVPYLVSLRRFRITGLDETARKIQFLMHISTKLQSFRTRREEYETIRRHFLGAVAKLNGTLEDFASSDYCFETTSVTYGYELYWPTTWAGKTASPREVCVSKYYRPLTRPCEGDFINGARWGDVQGRCGANLPKSEVTADLSNLLESDLPPETVVENLTTITERYQVFQQVDVYLVSRVLRKVSNYSHISLENVTSAVCNTNNINRQVLADAQANLNATDDILANYESILRKSNVLDERSHWLRTTDNVVLLIFRATANIRGLALIKRKSGKMEVALITPTTPVQELLRNKKVQALLLLHDQLLAQIADAGDEKLIVTVYFEDVLFNEETESNVTCAGAIFNVIVPDLGQGFKAPITIFFRKNSSGAGGGVNRTCAHWQFSAGNSKSRWRMNSGNLDVHDDLIVCDYWHATHYGMLVMSDLRKLDYSGINLQLLNVLSTVNCILSLAGLSVILLTSLLFRNWRDNAGNQVLINFVVALFFQITLLYVSSAVSDRIDLLACTIIGSLLHYFVISEFCWMLVIAILQYKRLVQVFVKPGGHIVLRTCLIGWILPIFPVAALLFASSDNYIKNNVDVCYPTNEGLYYGVLMPIGAIIAANFVIFFVIILNICRRKTTIVDKYNSDLIFQWRTIVLLFFMLGLSWTFALLSYLEEGNVFIGLFCLTATLQGFILFLFFVIFNKQTRLLYVNLFKRTCCAYR